MSTGRITKSMFSVPADQGYSHSCRPARAWSAIRIAGAGVMTEGADKLVMEKLVEALMKIGVTMADICKAQTVLAELLKDIHTEQQEPRAAMERLAALIEGRSARSLRPN